VSARSRALPWWGERHLPGAPTFAELEAQAEAEARTDRIDVHFAGVSFWRRERWTQHGHLLGRPVFLVERESWPADVVAEKDRVLREAGIIITGGE
jgi:hypothetical protein